MWDLLGTKFRYQKLKFKYKSFVGTIVAKVMYSNGKITTFMKNSQFDFYMRLRSDGKNVLLKQISIMI